MLVLDIADSTGFPLEDVEDVAVPCSDSAILHTRHANCACELEATMKTFLLFSALFSQAYPSKLCWHNLSGLTDDGGGVLTVITLASVACGLLCTRQCP